MQEVIVKALMVDPVSNIPVVILKQISGGRLLPIWLGTFEANAIAMRLENLAVPRPMTHDLLHSLVERIGARVTRVVVSDLRESTFYAEICLSRESGETTVDARPSDAIALALRAGAPIFVADTVFDKVQPAPADEAGQQKKLRALVDALERDDDNGESGVN